MKLSVILYLHKKTPLPRCPFIKGSGKIHPLSGIPGFDSLSMGLYKNIQMLNLSAFAWSRL